MNNEIKRKERKQNELSIQEIEEKIKTLNKRKKVIMNKKALNILIFIIY